METNQIIPQLEEPHITDSKDDQKPSSSPPPQEEEEEEMESEEDIEENLNPKPFEEEEFELVQNNSDNEVVNVCEDEKKVKPSVSNLILKEMIRYRGMNEDLIRNGIELIDESERSGFEARWKKLQIAELELFTRRAQLVEEQTMLILDALKKSSSSSSSKH